MLIDWFTVGAQALNFLILVWVMKHFLYKPILGAIDAREKQIAAALADADAQRSEAQQERAAFQSKNQELDQQRAALVTKATDEATLTRQRLLEDARTAADALTAKRQETLRNDARNLNRAISLRTQQEVFAIARKTLTDLAETSLEERMVLVFIQRLRALNGKLKLGLAGALSSASDPARVRSAFELPSEQRAAIQGALHDAFSVDIPLRFETAPELVSGIELTANGQKLAWNIAHYLSALERGVGELINTQPKSDPENVSATEPKHSA